MRQTTYCRKRVLLHSPNVALKDSMARLITGNYTRSRVRSAACIARVYVEVSRAAPPRSRGSRSCARRTITLVHAACIAYDRCSPLVLHIVISGPGAPRSVPNGWPLRLSPSVPKIYCPRELRRLSQRDVTRPEMSSALFLAPLVTELVRRVVALLVTRIREIYYCLENERTHREMAFACTCASPSFCFFLPLLFAEARDPRDSRAIANYCAIGC